MQMILGDLITRTIGFLGGGFDFGEKLHAVGVAPSTLKGLDSGQAKAVVEDAGFDLAVLDGLGLDFDEMVGHAQSAPSAALTSPLKQLLPSLFLRRHLG